MDSPEESDSNQLSISANELERLYQAALEKVTDEEVENDLLSCLLDERDHRIKQDVLIAKAFMDMMQVDEMLQVQISEQKKAIQLLKNRLIGLSIIVFLAMTAILSSSVYKRNFLKTRIDVSILKKTSTLVLRSTVY